MARSLRETRCLRRGQLLLARRHLGRLLRRLSAHPLLSPVARPRNESGGVSAPSCAGRIHVWRAGEFLVALGYPPKASSSGGLTLSACGRSSARPTRTPSCTHPDPRANRWPGPGDSTQKAARLVREWYQNRPGFTRFHPVPDRLGPWSGAALIGNPLAPASTRLVTAGGRRPRVTRCCPMPPA
jgi:hypothetical protein